MFVKQFNGKVFGASFTKKEEEAIRIEMDKYREQIHNEYADDIDAVILYTLHSQFGFGKERLRRFYDAVKSTRDGMVKRYEYEDDALFACKHKLEEIGVDVEKWNKELK